MVEFHSDTAFFGDVNLSGLAGAEKYLGVDSSGNIKTMSGSGGDGGDVPLPNSTLYVSAAYPNESPYFSNLTDAVAASNYEDTIIVYNGNYFEDVELTDIDLIALGRVYIDKITAGSSKIIGNILVDELIIGECDVDIKEANLIRCDSETNYIRCDQVAELEASGHSFNVAHINNIANISMSGESSLIAYNAKITESIQLELDATCELVNCRIKLEQGEQIILTGGRMRLKGCQVRGSADPLIDIDGYIQFIIDDTIIINDIGYPVIDVDAGAGEDKIYVRNSFANEDSSGNIQYKLETLNVNADIEQLFIL